MSNNLSNIKIWHSADVVKLINDGVNAKHKEALALEIYKAARTKKERQFVLATLQADLAHNYKNYVFRLDYFLKLADAKTDLFEMLMNPNFSNDCLAYYYENGEISSFCKTAGFTKEHIEHIENNSKFEFFKKDKQRRKKAFIAFSVIALLFFMVFYKNKFKKLINFKKWI